MSPNIEHLDDFPPEQRLALYLEEALAGADRDDRIRQLAAELGYKTAKTVQMWTTGAAKVPLRMVMPLAQGIGTDASNLLPLWISQEMGTGDADKLYTASKRMIDQFEFSIIAVAREVYLGDDNGGLKGREDTDGGT